MAWTVDEFLYELSVDPQRRVLFVEGLRDLGFWRHVVADPERGDTVVYPAAVLHIEGCQGGERGRLLRCAELLVGSPAEDRVAFFLDADLDRLQGKANLPSIFLTDGRDLESYGLNVECLECLVVTGLAKNPKVVAELSAEISEVVRPIGVLRVLSERNAIQLPFQATFESGYSRYFRRRPVQLDMNRLLQALLQNAGIKLSNLPALNGELAVLGAELAQCPDPQIVHGKDLVGYIASKFRMTIELAEAVLFLAIAASIDTLRVEPNLKAAEEWVRT